MAKLAGTKFFFILVDRVDLGSFSISSMRKIRIFVIYPQPPNFFIHTDRHRFRGIATGGDGLQVCQMPTRYIEWIVGSVVAKWTFRADRYRIWPAERSAVFAASRAGEFSSDRQDFWQIARGDPGDEKESDP